MCGENICVLCMCVLCMCVRVFVSSNRYLLLLFGHWKMYERKFENYLSIELNWCVLLKLKIRAYSWVYQNRKYLLLKKNPNKWKGQHKSGRNQIKHKWRLKWRHTHSVLEKKINKLFNQDWQHVSAYFFSIHDGNSSHI